MKDYKVDKESFSDSFRKEVYEVISQIPVGKVSTYGGIALLLGVPQCSRMVGRALKEVPSKPEPWLSVKDCCDKGKRRRISGQTG